MVLWLYKTYLHKGDTFMNNLQTFQDNNNFSITPCDDSTIANNPQYEQLKLSPDQKSSVNLFLQQIPSLCAADTIGALAKTKLYTLDFPKGVSGSLMNLKRGGQAAILQGVDGKITAVGTVEEVASQAARLQSACLLTFSIMSVATGQYFLTRINNDLDLMKQKIDKILDFLYGDKKAELLSEIRFVKDAYSNYSSLMNHQEQLAATIVGLQAARKTATKDIEFYLIDLDSKVSSIDKSYSDFEKTCSDALKTKTCLEMSMQLFIMSRLMEIHFAQNYDPDYITYLKETVADYVDMCDRRILSAFSSLHGKIGNYKPTVINKIDSSKLEETVNKAIDSLSNRTQSPLQNVLKSALNDLEASKKYYLSSDGKIFLMKKSA